MGVLASSRQNRRRPDDPVRPALAAQPRGDRLLRLGVCPARRVLRTFEFVGRDLVGSAEPENVRRLVDESRTENPRGTPCVNRTIARHIVLPGGQGRGHRTRSRQRPRPARVELRSCACSNASSWSRARIGSDSTVPPAARISPAVVTPTRLCTMP